MNLYDTVPHMRRLLSERGVSLTQEAEQFYAGPGTGAQPAWEAFRTVAVEPAFDPVQVGGELETVESGGFLFEASWSPARPARDADPARPDEYVLTFTRQFFVGEIGDMMGLQLALFFPGADDLRTLSASIFGVDTPTSDGSEPAAPLAATAAWIAEVQASPAFAVPTTRHRAQRFAFGLDTVG